MSADGNGVQRDLGRHDAQIDAIERTLEEIKRIQLAQAASLRAIETKLSEGRGSVRTLLFLIGASSAITLIGTRALALLGR
jgi:hypothetical protein